MEQFLSSEATRGHVTETGYDDALGSVERNMMIPPYVCRYASSEGIALMRRWNQVWEIERGRRHRQ